MSLSPAAAAERADARILLVEDDPDDIYIIRRIIGRAPISVDIQTCGNGQEALDYLESCGDADQRDLPDLILLDLNMPIMDGNEFIRRLRSESDHSALPVCVLTTSREEAVIQQAYEAGANAVVTKVESLEGMKEALNTIVERWFGSVQT